MSQKALVGIEQSTTAATLSRMERDGLGVRKPDPKDGRSFIFSLSDKATANVAAVEQAVREVNALALKNIFEPERENLLRALASVVSTLRQEVSKNDD